MMKGSSDILSDLALHHNSQFRCWQPNALWYLFLLEDRIQSSIIIYRLLSIPNIYFNIYYDYQGNKSLDWYFYCICIGKCLLSNSSPVIILEGPTTNCNIFCYVVLETL